MAARVAAGRCVRTLSTHARRELSSTVVGRKWTSVTSSQLSLQVTRSLLAAARFFAENDLLGTDLEN